MHSSHLAASSVDVIIFGGIKKVSSVNNRNIVP